MLISEVNSTFPKRKETFGLPGQELVQVHSLFFVMYIFENKYAKKWYIIKKVTVAFVLAKVLAKVLN